jgi:hypothetical protein
MQVVLLCANFSKSLVSMKIRNPNPPAGGRNPKQIQNTKTEIKNTPSMFRFLGNVFPFGFVSVDNLV